jgi:L-asparaginase / beta-aspartyl-peptidase
MDMTPHVILAGSGAADFACAQGCDAINEPKTWHSHAGGFEANHLPQGLQHSTVGCICLDSHGTLAAGISTAGVFDKTSGRDGDTPLIGSGTWANDQVAVSCTRQGEYFIRTQTAIRLALRYLQLDLQGAADKALQAVVDQGGEGGLICLTKQGQIYLPFATQGMKRAGFSGDGTIFAEAF